MYQALVLVNDLPRGGTIVNLNHVVTSCTVVLDSTNNHLRAVGQFTVRAGSITFAGGFSSTVTAVFPHPECDPWTLANDVAVIRVSLCRLIKKKKKRFPEIKHCIDFPLLDNYQFPI